MPSRCATVLLLCLSLFLFSCQAAVQQGRERSRDRLDNERGVRRDSALAPGVRVRWNLEFAKVDGESLRLDLFVPEGAGVKPPLLVWIHGGGWTRGSKSNVKAAIGQLKSDGYAVASIEYRLEGLKSHPKQIHDCKGAIRWLRANAEKYGYDATRVGVGGGSAGGHLALLLGLSAGVEGVEGEVGGNLDQSSRIQAIVDIYGPSDLETMTREKRRDPNFVAPEDLRPASPILHLTKDDPPVLIFHGDQDKLVPVSQSRILHEKYQEMGLESSLHIIEGAGHGGPDFSAPERCALVKAFFDKHIKRIGQPESAAVR